MNHTTKRSEKTATDNENTRSGAGPNGAALSPPDYGIDFLSGVLALASPDQPDSIGLVQKQEEAEQVESGPAGVSRELLREGAALKERITQYPLAQEENVQDYAFFFVSTSDPYGEAAVGFIRAYYPQHKRVHVTSFEDLFHYLHGEIAKRKDQPFKIREIVIITHGNAYGLNIPLTQEDRLKKIRGEEGFRNFYPETLAMLQQEFRQTEEGDRLWRFRTERQQVVAAFDENTRVTIRGCNFGQSTEGLFALYSFFGGTADVYAPKAYQTFALQPIGEDMRFEKKVEAFDYLLRQGFFPQNLKDIPAQEKAAAINKIIRKQRGRTVPIQFYIRYKSEYEMFKGRLFGLTAYVEGEDAAGAREFQTWLEALNRGELPDGIRQKFRENDEALSDEGVTVRPQQVNKKWVIRDRRRRKTYYILQKDDFRKGDDGYIVTKKLDVYRPVSVEEKLGAGLDYLVTEPSTPGPELKASLDRLSLEELVTLIKYLRATYQPEKAPLLLHAMEALSDKPLSEISESPYWNSDDPLDEFFFLTHASFDERHDARQFTNEISDLWAGSATLEARRRAEFEQDLFEEQRLKAGPIPAAEPLPEAEPEPTAETTPPARRAPETPRRERRRYPQPDFDKDRPYIPPPAPKTKPELTEADLKRILEMINMQGLENVRAIKIKGDYTLGDYLSDPTNLLSIALNVVDEIGAWAPASLVGRIAASRGFFALNLFWSAIISPVLMYLHFVELDAQARESWKRRGGRFGIEEGLLVIGRERWRFELGIPQSSIDIESQVPSAAEADLRRTPTGSLGIPFIPYYPAYEKGYREGVAFVEEGANELIQAIEPLVRQRLREAGLEPAQVQLVLDSGLIDLGELQGKALQAFSEAVREKMRQRK